MELPDGLAGEKATGLHKNFPVAQWELGPARNFVYLLLDWSTCHAAWVDPQSDIDPVAYALGQYGFTLQHVLLTHTHHDHIAGLETVMRRWPQVQAACHTLDQHRLGLPGELQGRVRTIGDGDVIKLGSLDVEVMHTPGHSAGECCFLLKTGPGYLCTGDTLFIRDCGRCDLETGSVTEMFTSLQRLKKLPKETVILPGHHYAKEVASTLEKELGTSGPLRVSSVAELGALP